MRNGKRFTIFSKLILLFLVTFVAAGSAQTLAIGDWRMHLPYKACKHVTGSGDAIWASTDNGLFRLNKADNSLERITKITGLSDLAIRAIGYNAYNGTLFVGYETGNIDLIIGNEIINLPDIKRAQIVGDKTIHNVFFVGDLAYVSTGFGIVVIDTHRKEVKDTYLIGPNGTYLSVLDIASDGTTIFAATENGIYHAPINSQNLANYASWTKFSNILGSMTNGTFDALIVYNGKLVANYARAYPSLLYGQDTVIDYDINTGTWDSTIFHSFRSQPNVIDFYVFNNHLYVCALYEIFEYDQSFTRVNNYFPVNLVHPGDIKQSKEEYVDQSGVWEVDATYGLIKFLDPSNGVAYYPNGPISTNAYFMASANQQLLVVPGGHDDAWNNVLNIEGISTLTNGWWTNYHGAQIPAMDTMYDFISAAIDPNDPNHYFLGSWGKGLVEITNGAYTGTYDNSNSPLQSKVEYQWVGISGLQYDTSGNMWIVNSHSVQPLVVKKKDGTFQAFDFTGLIPIGTTVSELLITSTGQKWMILPRGGGMLVFDDHGTLTNTGDDQKKRLGFTAGVGNIPGTEVYTMAEDRDGEIWIGTDKGIAVFYCASNIFDAGGCDAQQILITQETYVQILLETQTVTAIAVDGANRKWIGTEGGGVFLMSSDGQEELAHFTAANSPLLSDDITSLTIDQETGEVFFGTSKGIVSYMGEAIEGFDQMGEVYAFPNPVAHEYTGPIAITGLVDNADIKIADINGTVIYTTTALGGRAIWDGNNFKGERAASGVYMVFVSNADGTEKAVTKILLIK